MDSILFEFQEKMSQLPRGHVTTILSPVGFIVPPAASGNNDPGVVSLVIVAVCFGTLPWRRASERFLARVGPWVIKTLQLRLRDTILESKAECKLAR